MLSDIVYRGKNKLRHTNHLVKLIVLCFCLSCTAKPAFQVSHDYATIEIDDNVESKEEMVETIAPYKAELAASMNVVIGHSARVLEKQEVESSLGNLVADIILERSSKYYEGKIDLGVVNIGGLRATLPEGELTLGDIYALMPFENTVFILKLTYEEIQELFTYLASRKGLAIANSMVIIKNDQVEQVFIGGRAIEEGQTYTLAVPDYLAEGGDDMHFLKDAHRVAKLEMKLRDLIIEHIETLESLDEKVDARIEGRVKII